LDAALSMARDFDRPCAIVIKHNNPCGAAVADDLENAFLKAYAGDPLSAFGSVIGFNREVDEATATALTEPGRFVEAIIAPEFSAKAIEILTTRPSWKTNVRLLRTGDLDAFQDERRSTPVWRAIEGGVLLQQPDLGPDGFEDRQVVTQTAPNESQLRDLWFAWAMVKHVRSNAIVLVKDESLIGVGAGQMSRVDSVRISIEKAGERVRGSVMGSDAFFPFRDNIDLAAQAGVAAIIQPGGSKRDDESVQACNEHGIAMLFTGKRHFKH
jgi:phosphoribosylaminoimidazolecarboxamide formyltransferase/IMP cyclohydrolase